MKMHKRVTDSDFLKVSLSKSLYWLGSYMFFNAFLDKFWDDAIMGNVWGDIKLRTKVPDAVFCASVNAVVRKYLTGQAVLAVDIENKSWLAAARFG